jgi:uncharacterized membrane protein HdeD (DUF308 family)
MKGLRWLFAAALALLVAASATAAVGRPYADNQRNWMITSGVLSGLALAALLLSRPVLSGAREFARAIVSEWRTRE